MKNTADNVSGPQSGENPLVARFLTENDYSENTRRAFVNDLGKFSEWFQQANREKLKRRTGCVRPLHERRRRELPVG